MSEAMIDLLNNACVIGALLAVNLAAIAWLTRRPRRDAPEPCEQALPIVEIDRITPDQAFQIRPDARERARRLVANYVEDFIESGDDELVLSQLDPDDTPMIIEILEYKQLGWSVEFGPGCAVLRMPAVLS